MAELHKAGIIGLDLVTLAVASRAARGAVEPVSRVLVCLAASGSSLDGVALTEVWVALKWCISSLTPIGVRYLQTIPTRQHP